MFMGLIMFDPVSLGVASIGVARVSRVNGPARVSDLSARTRSEDEGAAFSHGSAEAAAGDRQGRDPVGLKAKAGDSRDGKRHQTDTTEEAPPRPKVKFRSPGKEGSGEPIFEVEGQPSMKRSEPILDPDVTSGGIGANLDVYA